MVSKLHILVGAAARGIAQRYQNEINTVLPPALADASFSFDLHDEDDIWDETIESCDALILTSRGFSGTNIARASKLRFVQKLGIDDDRVDVKACTARGITVCILPDAGHVAVAEHTILMILASARMLLPTHYAFVQGENTKGLAPIKTTQNARRSNWLGLKDFPLLSDSTLGLIGFGQIAREVAIRARALGLRVIYTKRTRLDAAAERALGVSYVSLDSLLEQAHFVSVHATQPDDHPPLVSASVIAKMREDAVLINTARGNQIDQAALISALKENRIKGAALDVYEYEPAINTELRYLPNVITTPHSAGVTTVGRRFRDALLNVVAFNEGRRPTGIVYE